MEEKIQIVDHLTGEPTGEIVTRTELFKRQLWCRSTNIFVMNAEGQILCHKRSADKERFPGVWSTHFGGHVGEGESFRINAIKELQEEIGLTVPIFQMLPWRTSCKEKARLWMRDFLTVYNGPLENLTMQSTEVDELAWLSPNEILTKIKTCDDAWCDELAGVHDIFEDYQCMRAVLTTCLDLGVFSSTYHPLHKWNPQEI